jgi:excisionase family DNA binding protein
LALFNDFQAANLMNSPQIQNQDQISIQFSGQISISRQSLKMLKAELSPENPRKLPPLPLKTNAPDNLENKQRAYTIDEAAKAMGISSKSIRRLIDRGLLKKSKALQKIIIPAAEIERF